MSLVNNKKVSILIPAYNEEESIPLLYKELKQLMLDIPLYQWELLFVNDGSSDNTLLVLKELREKDATVNFIDLSRNFGKERAMLAGFDYATGDCLVIMDADLQHPPFVIKDMLSKWEEGYDDVYARRLTRGKESWLRKQFSLTFYKVLQRISDIDILQNVGDFRLLDRSCINALKQLRESERYTKGLYCWIGYRKASIDFEQRDRLVGSSTWNFYKLLKLAVNGIVSFTTLPLRLATILGVVISCISILYMLYILFKTIAFGDPVSGFPTLITVMLFLGGVQLLCLGIIGEYIARIFNEAKRRPIYLVREYNNKKL